MTEFYNRLTACLTGLLIFSASEARAQFEDVKTPGIRLDKTVVEKIKIGMTITAQGGPCIGIVGTVPVPTEWPEQKVQILKEDVSPSVRKVEYRQLTGGTAKQMLVAVPHLNAGDEAHALVTFEITRRTILPPEDKSIFKVAEHPEKEKDAAIYLGPSPYIESRNPKIVKLAKEVTDGKENWDKVEAICDAVRDKIQYKAGDLKGALKGLNDGTGDCEEYSSLFIAMCRAENIPARTIWVPGHCYSEFYLVDDKGKGNWFPCQSAGAKEFGGITETRPILQKGDNFHDPDRPKDRLRYVNEFLKGSMSKGSGRPSVRFVQEEVK
ncbi:MAG TPA: transglutaminase domain-containing protein [Pirellulales bacterium]|nr:transglutaminase domain-containing protein [Pirellulales bacterium]